MRPNLSLEVYCCARWAAELRRGVHNKEQHWPGRTEPGRASAAFRCPADIGSDDAAAEFDFDWTGQGGVAVVAHSPKHVHSAVRSSCQRCESSPPSSNLAFSVWVAYAGDLSL